MAYATPADLLKRFDARVLGDLVSDSGTRVTPTGLLTDPNLAAALADGAGEINASILIGQRYTVAELVALTGDDAAFLIRLNCNLAFGNLNMRRGNDPDKFPAYTEAQDTLELLREGKILFNVPGDVASSTPQIFFPSCVTYSQVNLLRDSAGRFFPQRRQQTPSSGT